MRCIQKVSRLKLYLLEGKWTMNETFFHQISSFSIKHSYSSKFYIGRSTPEVFLNVFQIFKSYSWGEFLV